MSDAGTVVEEFMAELSLRDIAAGRDAASEPDLAADRRAGADGDAAENRGVGIDHDVVFHDRMPGRSFHERSAVVDVEPLGPQRNAVIEPHAMPDDGRFADDDAGPVVDEEVALNL